jgi:PAS domain S-box-containing protein
MPLTRLEETLAAERTRLAAVLDALPDAVWLKDRHGVYTNANPRFSALMLAAVGNAPASVIGKTDGDFLPADVATRVRQDDAEVLASGTPTIQLEWIGDDDNRRLIEKRKLAMPGPDGRSAGVLTVARDVTDAHRTETLLREQVALKSALAESRSHYKQLLDGATDAVHLLDMDGRLIEASPSFYRLLGYPPENPPPLRISDWDAQWSPDELQERIADVIKHRTVFETRHRRIDGTLIDVEVSARGIHIDGTLLLYASARDISVRKATEAALAAKVEELRDALNHIKTLRGVVPICAWCKKIRDDEGYWKQLESYVRDHTEAEFSHGICPTCAATFRDQIGSTTEK